MERFLVYTKAGAGPATHAIVMGVGDYPHLVDGAGRLSEWNDGMSQLGSPPLSARAFSDWLISTYHNPECPLATVALLLSDGKKTNYTPPGQPKVAVERATAANAEAALLEWVKRGNENAGNLLIFFFCGHGALAGTETSLLLEDFGENDLSPLKGAIDFRQFHLGMDKCKARRQVYFIDACRVATSAVLDAAGNYAGEPVISGSLRPPKGQPLRRAPVFYSTLAGAMAFARENRPSQYTEALLRALNGAADNAEADEKWRVKPTSLHQGIDALLKHAAAGSEDFQQVNQTDNLADFPFHELRGDPLVPVFVRCKPQNINGNAELLYSSSAINKKAGKGEDTGWDLSLTPGYYKFVATLLTDPCKKGEMNRDIRPVCREVEVEVKP